MKVKCKNRYIEMSFKDFIKEYPDALYLFPAEMHNSLMTDSEYIVRLSEDGKLEVGYASDNWSLK